MPRYSTLATGVTICCLMFLLPGCTKKHKEDAEPNYTGKMGGMRNWHRWREIRYTPSSNAFYDTAYFSPDTSFSLILVNNTTIDFLGKWYRYDTLHSNDSIYYFGYGFDGQYINGTGVIYYPKKNSILFVDKVSSHNGYDWTQYNTF